MPRLPHQRRNSRPLRRQRSLLLEALERRDLLTGTVSITLGSDAIEGGSGHFLLKGTGFTGPSVLVPISVSGGTATSTVDYNPQFVSTNYNFCGSCQNEYQLDVPAYQDQVVDDGETVIVAINTGPPGYIIADGLGSATLVIFEGPALPAQYTVNVTATDESAAEQGPDNGVFTLKLSPPPPPGSSVTVTYTLTGAATNGTDYANISPTSVSFGPGETTKTVTITPIDDSIEEIGGEDVVLTITNNVPSPYNPGPNYKATVQIADNDFVDISIDDTTALEGTSLKFRVWLAHAVDYNVTVDFDTSDGTAEEPDDYPSTSGTLTINAGQTSGWINVGTYNDVVSESTETMTVTLSNPVGAQLGDASGTGSIDDRPVTSQFWIDDVEVYEGESTGGLYDAIFTVRMHPPAGGTITIDYATQDGTAVASTQVLGDYTSTSGQLSFAAGETEKYIYVPIRDDEEWESTENFYVNLSNASAGTIQDGQGVGTILDNELLSLLDPTLCACVCSCDTVSNTPSATTGVNQTKVSSVGLKNTSTDPSSTPLAVNMAFPAKLGTPTSIQVAPVVGGVAGATTHVSTSGFKPGLDYRLPVMADLSTLATGRHVVEVRVTAAYAGGATKIWNLDLHQDVINQAASEFGKGWQPTWIDRLHVQAGNVTWERASGDSFYFVETAPGVFQRPKGELDFSTLTEDSITGAYTLTKKDGEKLTFSSAGILTSRKDRNNNTTTYAYVDADSDSKVDEISTVTDFAGGVTTFNYTGTRVSSIVDFAGRTTNLGYDGSGRLTTITEPDPDGPGQPLSSPVTTIAYDGTSSRIASITNPANHTTYIRYAGGMFAEIEHPDGGIEKFRSSIVRGLAGVEPGGGAGTFVNPAILFQRINAKATYENEVGQVWTYATDSFGNPTEITDPQGNVTKFARNADGLVTQLTEPRQYPLFPQSAPVTTFAYDTKGNVTTVTMPDGTQHTATYDANFSQPTQLVADPAFLNYATTNTVNSSNGNITQSSYVGNPGLPAAVTTYTYTPAPAPLSNDPPAGLVSTVTDPLGRVTRYLYDKRGNVTKIIYAEGTADEAFVEMTYNSADQLLTYDDELDRRTTFEWDNLDRMTKVTLPDPDGAGPLTSPVYAYEYTPTNRLSKETDPLGRQTTYVYTSRGDLQSVTRPDHDGDSQLTVHTLGYDLARRLTTSTDPLGRITSFVYDTLNRQTQVKLPDPVTGTTTANSPVYQTAYDPLDRPTLLTDPLGRLVAHKYEKWGNRVNTSFSSPAAAGQFAGGRIVEANPVSGSFLDYDHQGYPNFVTQDGFGSGSGWHFFATTGSSHSIRRTRWTYDAVGNLVQTQEPDGGLTTVYQYDARHRLTAVQRKPTPTGSVYSTETFVYDDANQLIQTTDAAGRVTDLEYDNLGRLKKRTDADPDDTGPASRPVTTFSYDAASRLTSVTDPLLHTTTYGYDALDNRTTITDANNGVTQLKYDAAGNLIRLIDPVGNDTVWVYDKMDRVISETNELNKTRTFEYDKASNLTKKTDRNNRVTEYVYDHRNRLTSELWKDGATTVRTLSFGYDLYDHLTSASDPAASFTFVVDGRGQVRSEQHTITGLTPQLTLTRTIDTEGRVTQLQTGYFTNAYTYDAYSRLTSLTQQGNGSAEKRVDFAYNVLDQFTSMTRYADVSGSEVVATTSFTYDGLHRLSNLSHLDPSSSTLASYTYGYDAASRITSINSHLDGLTSYTYDVTNQLTGADHTGQTDETYGYDLNGNRTTSGYSVGTNNRMSSDGTYNYTYDDEGNRLTKTKISNGEKEEYTWDYRNRLTKITFKNGAGTVIKTVDHSYDVFDRWTRRQVDPDGATGSAAIVDTIFAYDNLNIILEFDGPSSLAHRYLWGPAVDQILADENALGEILWPLTDHLGTVRDLAEYDSGTQTTSIANHIRYDSFGRVASESNPSVDSLILYTGRPFDVYGGYQYNWQRWYAFGIWLSEDPSGLGGQDANFRRYVFNNPVSLTDPTGLAPPIISGPTADDYYDRLYEDGDDTWKWIVQNQHDRIEEGKETAREGQREFLDVAGVGAGLAVAEGVTQKDLLDEKQRQLTEKEVCWRWTLVTIELGGALGVIIGRYVRKGKTAAALSSVWPKHHPFPMYLGGAIDQTLKKLPPRLHQRFHAALDIWKGGKYDRRLGAKHFKNMNKEQVISDLREFYETAEGGAFKDYLCDFEQAVKESGY